MPQKKKLKPKTKSPVAKSAKKLVKKPLKPAVKVAKAPVAAAKKPVKQAAPVAAAKPSVRAKAPVKAVAEADVVKAPVLRALSAKEQLEYKTALKNLRDRVVDEITFLSGDNLNRSQKDSNGDLSSYSFHMADQGTDNFDREFALNLVSSEQDVLYEIDEAIQRIDAGTYGACEMCGCEIEKARLKALPFAKMCISCKAESEKGNTRYRPFGQTISQTPET